MRTCILHFSVVGFAAHFVSAQHYCWPCAARHGVIGKDTHAATDADKCYDFFFKYLNNVVPSVHNEGNGVHEFKKFPLGTVNEAWDVPPNVFAAEFNECGTLAGDAKTGILGPSWLPSWYSIQKWVPKWLSTWICNVVKSPKGFCEALLVDQDLRLPTGEMHECPCAVMGRTHIINGTVEDVFNWSAVESSWGQAYTAKVRGEVKATNKMAQAAMEDQESAYFSASAIFGLHSVYCPFHASGPCKLRDVERGVAAAWAGNFSRGYAPLMDNNALYWAESLGPLLDALLRDGVDFFPMVWTAPASRAQPERDIYSVLMSPCGKQLVEVAAPSAGGRPGELFHRMSIPRAVFEAWNEPATSQPLVPLRLSRAVPASRLDDMLDFYGVGKRSADAAALGFGEARVLSDASDESGARAVTIMLSPLATVHLQLWVRPEKEPSDGPAFPSHSDFMAAAASNQVNGGQPADAQEFCQRGTWTVQRYSDYILAVHETVMSPPPGADADDARPPVGNIMDVFLDDHFAWDCTDPKCDLMQGGRALANFGSRTQWVNTAGLGGNWTPYSYDPVGYGFQLHWYHAPKEFAPHGPIYPECFNAHSENGTCPRAFSPRAFSPELGEAMLDIIM